MQRTLTSQLKSTVGQEVTLKGWLHILRDMGKFGFVILRDRAGLAQCVVEDTEELRKLSGLYTGTVLEITGTSVENVKSKYGYEVANSKITVLTPVSYPSPIDITKEDLNVELDTLLDNRVVTLRHPKQTAIFKVSSAAMRSIRESCYEQDFTEMSTSKIEGFPAEGGADCFPLKYFDKTVYLSQSPQLYKQIMCGVYERVFEIGRYFRAEKSATSRHMSEINMFDIEMVFLEDHEGLLQMTEKLFKNIVEKTWQYSENSLKILNSTKPELPEKFPRITCKELHELYFKETGIDIRQTEKDVAREEEPFICDYAKKHWNSEAVFITQFPWEAAKFYHKKNDNDPTVADRADLLFRGVEIATVPLRETRYDVIIAQMHEKGMNPEDPALQPFLTAFKYGMPAKQGGFGFGVARFVQKLIGLDNVKEAELFPRDMTRVTP